MKRTHEKTASWVIRVKATKEVIMETYNPRLIKTINSFKYEAIPIQEYLGELNRQISKS